MNLARSSSTGRRARSGFRVGSPAEFTLTQEETQHLIRVLREGLTLADVSQDGEFVLVRVDGKDIETMGQPLEVAQSLTALLNDKGFVERLLQSPDGSEALTAVQFSARLAELHDAVDILETALNEGQQGEQFYQEWCEKHSWAFGNVYAMRDDVRNIALGDQVDLLMATTANGFRDIFELKRPDRDAISWDQTHRSFYWTTEASKAIGQCHRYLDALHESAAKGLRDHPEVVAYHPRAVIVLGRSADWDEDKHRGLHGLNSRLHGITVLTYDQLLLQAKQLLNSMESDDGQSGVPSPNA